MNDQPATQPTAETMVNCWYSESLLILTEVPVRVCKQLHRMRRFNAHFIYQVTADFDFEIKAGQPIEWMAWLPAKKRTATNEGLTARAIFGDELVKMQEAGTLPVGTWIINVQRSGLYGFRDEAHIYEVVAAPAPVPAIPAEVK